MSTATDGVSSPSACVSSFCGDYAASSHRVDGVVEDCSYDCNTLANRACPNGDCCTVYDMEAERWPTTTTSSREGGAIANEWVTVSANSARIVQGRIRPDPRNLRLAHESFADAMCGPEDLVVLLSDGNRVPVLPLPGAPDWAGLADMPIVITDPVDGCVAVSDGSLAGKVALIRTGSCDVKSKVTNAQNAGATAVVVYYESDAHAELSLRGMGG